MNYNSDWGLTLRSTRTLRIKPRKAVYLHIRQLMIRAIRSYFTSLKASRIFGRASRLRSAGRKEEALSVARQSLAVLREPWVVRRRPAEGSVLLCTVMLVEQVASELNQPGAEEDDLSDALAYLNNLPPESSLEIFGSDDWVPYFESRLRIKGQPSVV